MGGNHYEFEEKIRLSKDTGVVLSIVLKKDPIPIVTAVKNYLNSAEIKVVEVMPETLYGQEISRTKILLNEIMKITILNVHYDDPTYVRLRESKKKFLKTHQDFN